MLGLARQLAGRAEHLGGGRAGLLGGLGHAGDVARHLSVPVAAWATLRTISCVAAPCCSTAAAIVAATPSISRMRAADRADGRDRLARHALDLADLPG